MANDTDSDLLTTIFVAPLNHITKMNFMNLRPGLFQNKTKPKICSRTRQADPQVSFCLKQDKRASNLQFALKQDRRIHKFRFVLKQDKQASKLKFALKQNKRAA